MQNANNSKKISKLVNEDMGIVIMLMKNNF